MKINSSLLPPSWFEDVIHKTLDMYERGEDTSNSPLIQWATKRVKDGAFYAWCEDKASLNICLLMKQKEVFDTYESFKAKGYDGSKFLIYFNRKGQVGYWDGNHRMSIIRYLGIVADLNVEIAMVDPKFSDFPLLDVLHNNPPVGKWLYQPVDDPRVKDFHVQRTDSDVRLEFVLKNLVGKTVLDIGCSEGFFCRGIAERGYQVTGVEHLSDLLGAARYLTLLRNLKVDFVETKWENYILGCGRFDNVLILSTLHHTIKKHGIDKAFELLGKIKAKRLFVELPMSAREVGFLGPENVPLWDFTEKELAEKVEESTSMKHIGSFVGLRPMLVFEKQGVPHKVDYEVRNEDGASIGVRGSVGPVCPQAVGDPGIEGPPGLEVRYRFHILGLPHTKTTKEYMLCAYTQKIFKLCGMLMSLGHEVFHYGAEGSNPPCTEHIDVITDELQQKVYGDQDWHKYYWRFSPQDEAWKTFERNAIMQINRRQEAHDILLIPFGYAQKPIADGTGVLAVESGIGYPGVFAKYRVFESYTWMHYIWGLTQKSKEAGDGRFYDFVVPNYYDPEDFEYSEKKDDYFLYMGRLTARKGPHVASNVVKKAGGRLVIAGQGNLEEVSLDKQPHVEYVGTVDAKGRTELMKNAKAVIVPTLYIGPFEGVVIEANFCGTPVITTDFGVFPETVLHGKTGFRCRTMDDFVWAAKNVDRLKPMDCWRWASENYSTDRVRWMYQEVFFKVMDLFKGGWEEIHDDRDELSWLNRQYV